MNHTPGPWKVINGWDKNGKGKLFPSVVIYHKENDICGRAKITINVSHDQERESLMANAYLIAASPEMKCVLENIKLDIDVFDAQCSDLEHTDTDTVWQMFNDFRKIIEVTLAQAKGE